MRVQGDHGRHSEDQSICTISSGLPCKVGRFRRRSKREPDRSGTIRKVLPYALDLLCLAVEAGLDFTAALPVDDDGDATFRARRAGRLDGFVLWTVVESAGVTADAFAAQRAWLPVFIPLPAGGVDVADGARIVAAWRRRTATGVCPDYFIDGVADGVAFACVSRHAETATGTTALHRALAASRPADDLSPEALRAWLARRIPDYMVPAAWVRLARLPVNTHGKLDRAALPEPGRGRPPLATPRVPPADTAERRLAEAWSEILGIDDIGRDDDFFDLGGDSVAAVRLTSTLQRWVDAPVPLAAVFEAPTVARLADWLRAQGAATPAWPAPGGGLAVEEGEL